VVSGAANVAQLKQQGVKQLADEWFQKESLAVDREKIKSAEKLGLEGIDTKIKIAELNAAIKTSIQEGKNEVAEKLMGIRDRMADIAMMNAVTAQGRAGRVGGLTEGKEADIAEKLAVAEGNLLSAVNSKGEPLTDPSVLQGQANFYNKYDPDFSYVYTPPVITGWGTGGSDQPGKWTKVPKKGGATTKTFSVTAPNGKTYTFPTQEQLDAFKVKAGIK